MTPAEAKKGLRTEARRRPAPTAAESRKVCEQVFAWLGARRPAPTLVWLAMPDELDLGPVVSRLPEVEWITTRTPPSGPLTVHPYHSESELHRFGFRQPLASAPQMSPARIEVALVPGLAFDGRGGRVGRGKGYYDRLLTGLSPSALRVGVTLHRLMTESVPYESYDVSMTHLITESGVFEVV